MASISENLQTIADSLSNIKQSIINKGGVIEGDISTYSTAIDSLPNGGASTEYNIDMDATTENNVNVYNFLNGLLSSITCNGKEIGYIGIGGSYIVFNSIENSAYNIFLHSDGQCQRSNSGGGAD